MSDGRQVEWESDGFPPRGSGVPGRDERTPTGTWGHPWRLGPSWDWKPGDILLGHWHGREIGWSDNRHVVTVAGSRAGKTTSVLIPNLERYPGSALVLDPKGELARRTAATRRAMGQTVHILDPFGETGAPSASHNPFDELLDGNLDHIGADAAQLADALIVSNEKDPHWTDSAKNLIRGITLHLLSGMVSPNGQRGLRTDERPETGYHPSIRTLRELLSTDDGKFEQLLTEMQQSEAFDGLVANVGASFLGKLNSGGAELQSILSTAQEQTVPLDDLRHITDRSDFRLRELKERPMTIYLVLPGMRMGTHFRWLRVIIQQAMAALELSKAEPEHPVLFLLEEFPVLGYMRPIETAAGFIASFGVKLWTVLQDFSQLKMNYPNSWETFLGNAGVIQAFGNVDLTTTEYLSKRLGQSVVVETQTVQVGSSAVSSGDLGRREQLRHVPLLEASEVTPYFSRKTYRQLVLTPEHPPVYLKRFRAPD